MVNSESLDREDLGDLRFPTGRWRMKLTWDDAEEIAEALSEAYPDIDPLTLSFPKLHRMITGLADFADNPEASTEGKLEAIQMAWYEMWKEEHADG